MRKFHLLLTLVALFLATTSLWAKPAVADANGKLPGAFSVACGRQVYFSHGNLQYQASSNTWRFAENQYDAIGGSGAGAMAPYKNSSSGNQTSSGRDTQSNWIDLFQWGTGNNPTLATNDKTFSFTDWGGNTIHSGEDVVSTGWRTLTNDEITYLLASRHDATNLRGLATIWNADSSAVIGVGLIILPDGWIQPNGCAFVGTIENFEINNYKFNGGWERMEQAGALFLPAAGNRQGTQYDMLVNYPGTYGSYWTSTRRGGSSEAYRMTFGGARYSSSYTGELEYNVYRSSEYAYAVRLVQDVDPADVPETPQAYVTSDPVGKTNMTYTGSSQTLLSNTASGATGGTVKYRVGTSGSWGTATSYYSATNAGDYIVQWFVDHTGNSQCYVSSDVQEIHVTIKRRATSAPSPKPTIAAASSLTYNGSAQDLVTTTGSIQSGYTAVYSTDGVNWSTTIPQETNAGDYTVYYKFYKGNNEEYVPSPNTINASIAQADLDLSGVALPGSTSSIPYDGTEKTLLEIEDIPDCTVWYKLGDGEWTTTPPTETDANAYSVQYKIVPSDPNYKTYGPNTVTVTIMDYPTVSDHSDATTIATVLNNLADPWTLKVARTIYANDEYNTLCLPFSLDASALAASPLAGFNRLKTLRGAKVTGIAPDLSIDILVEDATTIEAGIPYLISYPSAHADIVNPVFENVTETTTTPSATSADGVTFQGMFAQVHIDPYASERDEDYLFLGANSQLMWPASSQTDSSIKMRGFRAYFIIDRSVITPALAPKGTRARIVDAPKTATGIDDASAKFGESQKILENGILYIIRNGVRYNAQGQIVK